MKKILMASLAFLAIGIISAQGEAQKKDTASGEDLFREHCSACHPDGGNIINPGKTLRKASLEEHKIINRDDIVEKMRHPGKGMTSWSSATISDEAAYSIADYIIKTFR